MRALFLTLAALSMTSPAYAATAFGTKEEAQHLAKELVAIIEQDGVVVAAQAVVDPAGPFRRSSMGINLFVGSTVIADNREPETVAIDYDNFPDLNGNNVWPLISAAADRQDDALLRWYHYDTQEAYDFRCFSLRASRDDGLVMVCR